MLRLLVVFLCLNVAFGESLTGATKTTAPTNVTTTAPKNVTTTTAPTNVTTTAPTNVTTTAPKNVTTTAPKNVTTTAPTNVTTIAPKNVTTTAPTNVTTTAPTNVTTTAPTNVTTTAPTNVTTTVPTNVTTKPAATTSKPTPPYGTYAIKGKDGKFCLLAQFKAIFTIYYVKHVAEGNKTNATKETEVTIALNSSVPVNVSGDCGRLILTWSKPEPFYTLTIEFAKVTALQASDESSFTWRLKGVSFLANLIDNPDFENATVNMVNASHMVDNDTLISGANGSYYYCKAGKQLNLMTNEKGYKVSADFTDWKVEPFAEKSSEEDFGSGKECDQDKPTATPSRKSKDNDIVPIAVGCALAGLVLIVLIAYVIGRRKSHRGYEKV